MYRLLSLLHNVHEILTFDVDKKVKYSLLYFYYYLLSVIP